METSIADTGVVGGSLCKCFSDGTCGEPVRLVVSGLKASGEQTRRLTGAVSDFEMTVAAAFSGRLLAQHDSGKLVDGAIIAVKNFQCSEVEGAKKIMVLDLDVAGKYRGADLPKLATPASAGAALANFPPVSPSEMPVTPAGPSSIFEFKTPTSAMPTPPMTFASSKDVNTPPLAGNLPHQPIQSLNPYKSKFTIKVKVDSKQPLKSAVIKGETTSILTMVLVDTEGSQIEGTFWREMAVEMDQMLKEGSVYYISNGQLGGANRRYSTTGNDYRINFNQKTEVKAAPDQDASKMNAKCNFVKIDCLEAKITQKLPVDIVGVVTDVGTLGSIKRKQDDTEFVRRDITLVDDSRKSVMVTLWRQQAEQIGTQLEALQSPILVMTKMRVGDYNGVSVSSTYGSHFIVDPTGYPEAVALQRWWESEGSNQTFSPAGDSSARAGMKRLSKWQAIESVVPDKELSADDAPIYASLNCVIAQIPEEQTLYYQANPANNKKVEMNGSGKYIEVGTGEVVDDMRRRYILNAQVMDFTNTTFVNIFNEQAEEILGMGADELNAVKEDPEQDISTVLGKPAWSTWTYEVMAKPREYNGKTKMRVNVRSVRRMDYATDSSRIIDSIVEMRPIDFPQLVTA